MGYVEDTSGHLSAWTTTKAGMFIESKNRRYNSPKTGDSSQRVALLGQCILDVMDDDFKKSLKERGHQGVDVLNWSAPGVAVKHLIDKTYLANLVASIKKNKVDTVIVFKGGNDLLQGRPIEKIKEDLDTYLTAIKTSGANILLIGVRSEDIKTLSEIKKYPATYIQEAEAMFASLAQKHGLPFYSSFFKGLSSDDYLDIKKDVGSLIDFNSKSYSLTRNGAMELSSALFDLAYGLKELHPNHIGQAKIANGIVDFMSNENLIPSKTPEVNRAITLGASAQTQAH